MLEFPFTAVRFHKYLLRRIDRNRTWREYEDRGEGRGERGKGRGERGEGKGESGEGGVGGLEQECDGKTQIIFQTLQTNICHNFYHSFYIFAQLNVDN